MNKDKKRFRQTSIIESFSNCKKSKNNLEPTMEQNLRDLMVAAAVKRMRTIETTTETSDCSIDLHHPIPNTEEIPDSDEFSITSSQDLFPESYSQLEEYGSNNPENDFDASSALSDMSLSTETIPETGAESLTESDIEEESIQLQVLNKIPDCSIFLPKMEPLENHYILFSPHIRIGSAPRPYPSSYQDKWDFNHVRMPCSPFNKYPVGILTGSTEIRSRWDLICRSLSRNIESSQQLEEAIMKYNYQYKDRWNFNSLHAFFNLYLSEDEQLHFFETILPPMIAMAKDLPNICTQPPPLMKQNKDFYLTLSQKQIACLLLNAFFCTFPRRNLCTRSRHNKVKHEYYNFPDINFNRLFTGVKNKISSSNAEKLKCLINYFRRITSEEPTGTVTFHRQCLSNFPDWKESTEGIRTVIVKSDGTIESEGSGMLQVDFANKFVGGGVLGNGCVQEEIRFVICPELIVSRLFVECLDQNEVLIVKGVEQYNKYSGYSDTFTWEGNFQDQTPRDRWGRRCTQIVAMDAMYFRDTNYQFKPFCIERELNKAFCGFYEDAHPGNLSAVATGNWGCGAFKGDPSLKFIIQLMAVSQAGRDMLYFTFGNKSLKRELKQMYALFIDKHLSIGDLWRILVRYSNKANMGSNQLSLNEFIFFVLTDHKMVRETKDAEQTMSEVTDDEQALRNLITAVNEDSDTEIEDNVDIRNEPG